jgi:hydroxypyruvate reductase
MLTGEAREAAMFISGIAQDVRRREMLVKRPACVILGGETVVTSSARARAAATRDGPGLPGPDGLDEERGRGIHFLSASTDGSDGPTDAGRGFASTDILERAKSAGLVPRRLLCATTTPITSSNASTGCFKTGPTMTNVCDLHILLVPEHRAGDVVFLRNRLLHPAAG